MIRPQISLRFDLSHFRGEFRVSLEQHFRVHDLNAVIEVDGDQNHQLVPNQFPRPESNAEGPLCPIKRGRRCELTAKFNEENLRQSTTSKIRNHRVIL